MESNGNSRRTYYNGTFLHGVDDKRRVQVPAKWRPAQESTELTLILWPQSKIGSCIRVLPPERMDELMRDIDAMPNREEKASFKRFIGSESVQVTLDKAGRIVLPEKMAQGAKVGQEAMFVGLLDRFEIWDPHVFEQVKAADETVAKAALQMMQ